MSQDMGESQGIGTSSVAQNVAPVVQQEQSAAPSSNTYTQAPVQSHQASAEKRFTQEEVNAFVGRVRQEAREAAQNQYQAQSQYAQQQPTNNQGQQFQQAIAPRTEDLQAIVNEQLNKAIGELTKAQEQARMKVENEQLVSTYMNKVAPGKQKYQDFDEVTQSIDYGAFLKTVKLATNYVDNLDDLMYEFGKDPAKLALMEDLAERSERSAVQKLQSMAKALKDNANAKSVKQPNEPLTHLRPTNSAESSGELTVADFKKKYRFK